MANGPAELRSQQWVENAVLKLWSLTQSLEVLHDLILCFFTS
jgi:hypothetical protein